MNTCITTKSWADYDKVNPSCKDFFLLLNCLMFIVGYKQIRIDAVDICLRMFQMIV